MDGTDSSDRGWFEGIDRDAAAAAIRSGSAEEPADWPARAVEAGFAADEADYYDALHETTAARVAVAVAEAERAGDRQLVHAVRAMDDIVRIL